MLKVDEQKWRQLQRETKRLHANDTDYPLSRISTHTESDVEHYQNTELAATFSNFGTGYCPV